jgi:transcriptional regulator with GAF, ATPase, and Fis domain
MAERPGDERATDEVRVKGALVLRARKIRVEIASGPGAGQVASLPGPEARIGSGAGCDLVLEDTTVSRLHVTLVVDPAGIRVIDAGSKNGTTVDGLRVRDAWARPDSLIAIGNTTLRLRLLDDVIELPLSQRERFGALLGKSVGMRRIFAVLEKVAPTESTVLVEGETGTGKELVAEAIHEESPRASGPFVVFDCSAVSATLIESELFGHVRGAFTGAVADRAGAFEAADGGTLFLDEIGELPMDLQPKLLRALERLEVRRVGSNTPRKVDVRIVAATNRTLSGEVDEGRFREDLYYRLAVVRVNLPPLRERADDIPLLVERFARDLSRGTTTIPDRSVRHFMAQSWPGNVRELRNAVARALSLGVPTLPATGELVPAAAPVAAPQEIDLSVPLKTAREHLEEAFERAYLTAALAKTGGNVTRAAELAGVNRKFIQRAIKRYALRGDGDGGEGEGGSIA